MKGYLAFPPSSSSPANPAQSLKAETIGVCATWIYQNYHEKPGQNSGSGNKEQAVLEAERRKRHEQERMLGERSEIEWVRAGGVLRDAFGRRDRVRTAQIRQELQDQDMEKQRMARWEAYEARWRTMQSPSMDAVALVAFVDFPWPVVERLSSRDLSPLTHTTVSEFLFESLSTRTNTTTKKERIRKSLLRWHPDKVSLMLTRAVVPDDLELVREGVHLVFGVLRALQDVERTRAL